MQSLGSDTAIGQDKQEMTDRGKKLKALVVDDDPTVCQ